MSATYTLHLAPRAVPGDPQALDQASLVRDGFSWGAFLVPPLWFLAHRHWLLALGVFLLLAAFWAGLRQAGMPGGASFLLNALLWFLVGLEASSLRRWDYARRGRPAVDAVFAANEAEAEAKSFARWLSTKPEQPAAPASAAPPPVRAPAEASRRTAAPWRQPEGEQVIGLFPDVEGRR
ncbi:DUF2628 domain-containing protein [Enterovirga sp.]|uniref:DUF2628 domain-containing protein n=1 Tax=Enterovirga sp. TaxID=2026350 RepID=UPI002B57A895|nr:DUF2628 domain-containing protein [Enterovirga sp.]HMO28341.1 DUF2628 domain-containing protein [Enterovirga sp.]